MAAAKRTDPGKPTAKKTTAKKPAAKRTTAKKAPAKKPAAKKTTAKKAPAKQSATSKTAAEKPAAKKAPTARKAPAKQTAAAKTAAKKTTSKKQTVEKQTGKKPTGKKQTVTKSTGRRRQDSSPPMLSNERPTAVELPKPRGTTKDGISYTKDFDVKFLKAQRAELEQRRAAELARATRLEDEATSLIEDGEMGDVQFDDEGGEGDTMVVQRDLDRVLSNQSRQTVAEIDAALERIRNGTYGYSEVSGTPIPRERLEAIPETTVLASEKVSGIGRR